MRPMKWQKNSGKNGVSTMSSSSYLPKAKLSREGWTVEVGGAMAGAMAEMAGGTISDDGTVLYTRQLDKALMALIDALIHLRYDAGRVRLTLFDQEEVGR
jgi:hypothetical protein